MASKIFNIPITKMLKMINLNNYSFIQKNYTNSK